MRESVPVRPMASRIASVPPSGAWADASGLAGRLMPPQLVTYLKASIEGSDVLFEGRNSEGDGACVKCSGGQRADLVPTDPHEVLYVGGKQTQWLDYLSSPVLALTATPTFCAAAM